MSTKVAVIQKPPVLLDRDKTIERALESIDEAAREGATLLIFPEAYIPGYPMWIWRLKPGGDMALASEAYDLFLANYPRSEYRMRAMQRRIYASIARYKGPRYDSKPLADAQVLIRRFMVQYPAQAQQTGLDEALLVRVDESGAQTLLQTADWYLSRGDRVSARYTLKRLIVRHPQTNAAARAMDICRERGWLDESSAPAPGPEAAGEDAAPGSRP